MNGRERVLAVLAGEIPDRVPWVESTVDDEVVAPLLGKEVSELTHYNDRVRVPPELRTVIPLDNLTYDFTAKRFSKTVRSGHQDIITDGLIKTKDDLKLLDGLHDPDDEAIYRPAEEFLRDHHDDAAAMAIVRTGISNTYLSMGIDHFSISLIENPELVKEILHRYNEWSIRVVKNLRSLPFDLFLIPDDTGFSNAPMMSLPHFREFCLPVMKSLVSTMHLPAIYHSDGNIYPLLPDIASTGVKGVANMEPGPMDIRQVKREFGDRLTIVGNVDLHYTLTLGTPEDTKTEVKGLIESVGLGGHYILATANSIPNYAKVENVRAMGEALLEYGSYPLGAEPQAAAAQAPAAHVAAAPAAESEKAAPKDDGGFEKVRTDVFDGDNEAIKEHVQQLLDQGHSAHDILEHGMISAMAVIGEKFRVGELFIPEVLLSARAMNDAIALLEPHFATEAGERKGKVLLGTVFGDMHNIGKNIVATMLRGSGYEILDLGINVSSDQFVSMVAEFKPNILGLSCLLTSTMPEMRNVIEALKAKNLRDGVKIMIGGAPVNEKYANEIGADGYASNAGDAVAVAKRLSVHG